MPQIPKFDRSQSASNYPYPAEIPIRDVGDTQRGLNALGEGLQDVGKLVSHVDRLRKETRQVQTEVDSSKLREQYELETQKNYEYVLKNGKPDGSDFEPMFDKLQETTKKNLLKDYSDPITLDRAQYKMDGVNNQYRLNMMKDSAKTRGLYIKDTMSANQNAVESRIYRNPDDYENAMKDYTVDLKSMEDSGAITPQEGFKLRYEASVDGATLAIKGRIEQGLYDQAHKEIDTKFAPLFKEEQKSKLHDLIRARESQDMQREIKAFDREKKLRNEALKQMKEDNAYSAFATANKAQTPEQIKAADSYIDDLVTTRQIPLSEAKAAKKALQKTTTDLEKDQENTRGFGYRVDITAGKNLDAVRTRIISDVNDGLMDPKKAEPYLTRIREIKDKVKKDPSFAPELKRANEMFDTHYGKPSPLEAIMGGDTRNLKREAAELEYDKLVWQKHMRPVEAATLVINKHAKFDPAVSKAEQFQGFKKDSSEKIKNPVLRQQYMQLLNENVEGKNLKIPIFELEKKLRAIEDKDKALGGGKK